MNACWKRVPVSDASGRGALLMLLTGASILGFGPLLVRWSPTGLSATAAWRLLLSMPFFLFFLRAPGENAGWQWRGRDACLLAIPGVLFAFDLAFWHQSLARTSVANATLFTNAAPIFVALAGWLWLKERLHSSFWAGLIIAVGGAAVMSLIRQQPDVRPQALNGDALGLASAVFYAGYQLAIKRLRDRFSTAALMTGTAAAGGGLLMAAAAASGEVLLPDRLSGWWILLALGCGVQVAGQGLIVRAMRVLPASFVSVSLLLQVVVSIAVAWVLLPGETLNIGQGFGAALILTGIVLARRGAAPAPRTKEMSGS